MSLNTKNFRSLVVTLAVISGMIAIVEVAGIIPPILKDTSPGANPAGAAIGFCINAGLYLVMAIALIVIALRSSDNSSRRPGALGGMGGLSLLLTLALLDASDAFRKSGPPIAAARRLMLLGAGLGFLLGILLIIAAIVFRKRGTVAV